MTAKFTIDDGSNEIYDIDGIVDELMLEPYEVLQLEGLDVKRHVTFGDGLKVVRVE